MRWKSPAEWQTSPGSCCVARPGADRERERERDSAGGLLLCNTNSVFSQFNSLNWHQEDNRLSSRSLDWHTMFPRRKLLLFFYFFAPFTHVFLLWAWQEVGKKDNRGRIKTNQPPFAAELSNIFHNFLLKHFFLPEMLAALQRPTDVPKPSRNSKLQGPQSHSHRLWGKKISDRQTFRADYTFIILENRRCQDEGYNPVTFRRQISFWRLLQQTRELAYGLHCMFRCIWTLRS